jgi:hypothetical protein
MRIRRIVSSPVACPGLQIFTLSHKLHNFAEKVIEYKMRVLICLQHLSETFFIIRRLELDINIHRCPKKVSLFLSDGNKIDFSGHIFENNVI